jgi:hypothetical protein
MTLDNPRVKVRWTDRRGSAPLNMSRSEIAVSLMSGRLFIGRGGNLPPFVLVPESEIKAIADALDGLRDISATDADIEALSARIDDLAATAGSHSDPGDLVALLEDGLLPDPLTQFVSTTEIDLTALLEDGLL